MKLALCQIAMSDNEKNRSARPYTSLRRIEMYR